MWIFYEFFVSSFQIRSKPQHVQIKNKFSQHKKRPSIYRLHSVLYVYMAAHAICLFRSSIRCIRVVVWLRQNEENSNST